MVSDLDIAMPDDGALARLTDAVGMTLPAMTGEHDRFHVYDEALRRPDVWPVLLPAIAAELNADMAESYVVRMMGRVADADVPQWLAISHDRDDALLAREEWGKAHRIADGTYVPTVREIKRWSWRQALYVIVETDDRQLLELIERKGGERGIRAQARYRLRALSWADRSRPA